MATRRRSTSSQPHAPTRELLLQEAERLIAKNGVAGFTLKDVVAPLGVQVPSVYKHYTSRDDVLIALSRRYIDELSQEFTYPPEALEHPFNTLKSCVLQYARFHIMRPAYVRLALVDFGTPDGGIEYLRLAAGGPFRANVSTGPLTTLHKRLQKLLNAGHRCGEFRVVSAIDFFRVVKGALMLRVVFPDDLLADPKPSPAVIRTVESWTWDVAHHYVLSRPRGARKAAASKSDAGPAAAAPAEADGQEEG